MRWVLLALRRSNPRTYPAFVDAFALGSNPAIDRTLLELCRDDNPALVEVALEALCRRGRADVSSIVLLLMRPSSSLVGKAIDLTTRLPAPIAIPLLTRLVEGGEPFASASAAAALLILGDTRGEKHLRVLLQRARNEDPQGRLGRRIAFEALCLLGNPFDRNLLATEASIEPGGLPMLGFHGHPDHVPVLREATRRAFAAGSFEEVASIAGALERIGGGTAPRATGFGAAEFEERLAAWVRMFDEQRPSAATRLRFGKPFAPNMILTELSGRETKQGLRPLLCRELALHTRRVVFFDPAGWVVGQERAFAAVRELLSRQP